MKRLTLNTLITGLEHINQTIIRSLQLSVLSFLHTMPPPDNSRNAKLSHFAYTKSTPSASRRISRCCTGKWSLWEERGRLTHALPLFVRMFAPIARLARVLARYGQNQSEDFRRSGLFQHPGTLVERGPACLDIVNEANPAARKIMPTANGKRPCDVPRPRGRTCRGRLRFGAPGSGKLRTDFCGRMPQPPCQYV